MGEGGAPTGARHSETQEDRISLARHSVTQEDRIRGKSGKLTLGSEICLEGAEMVQTSLLRRGGSRFVAGGRVSAMQQGKAGRHATILNYPSCP